MYFTFSKSAGKDVQKLPGKLQHRIRDKLVFWQGQANPLDFAKPLVRHREATHRFRIGAYRLLVKANGDELRILRIRHRKDVYKK